MLDENLPQALRLLIGGHSVVMVGYQGWAGVSNGALVALAEDARFDVMLTADQGLSYQQNMAGRRLALVDLSTNRRSLVSSNAIRVTAAVDESQPGRFVFLNMGS